MREWLGEQGYEVNRKRVRKLYKKMGLQTLILSQISASRKKGNISILICSEAGISLVRMRPGQLILLISQWKKGLCTWEPLLTSIAGMWLTGA